MLSFFAQRPYIIAILFALALGIWLSIPQPQQDAAPNIAPQASPAFKVQVQNSQAQNYQREITITGRTAPYRIATLKSEIDAKVVKIHISRGQRVTKNQLIMTLATGDRDLLLKQAQASLRQYETTYNAMKNLAKKGFQAEVNLAEALSNLEMARTQVKQAQLQLEYTKIHAAFAGVVLEQHVEEGDYVTVATAVASIMDEEPFLVVGDVNEIHYPHLKLNQTVQVDLATGISSTGKITFISPKASTEVRTFRVEIAIPNPQRKLAAGITAKITIPVQEVKVHKLSASLLSLDDQGRLGIKAVDEQQVVFHAAKLVHSDNQYVWLQDLPPILQVISIGVGFVRAGDRVTVGQVI